MAPETDFGCESYALLKKGINYNQRATWKVEYGPCGDAPPYLNFPIRSLLNELLYEVTHFYRIRMNHFYNEVCWNTERGGESI
jgi:hypothetical protein